MVTPVYYLSRRGMADFYSYEIPYSCRFNAADSAYTRNTINSVADDSNQKKTFSIGVKRCTLGTAQQIYSCYIDANNIWGILFDASDHLQIYATIAGVPRLSKITTDVYRDPTSHMHIFYVIDTTLATAEDRVQLWVNGVRVTSFGTNTIPTQNYNVWFQGNAGGNNFNDVGIYASLVNDFDGYMSEFRVLDNTADVVTTYGEFKNNIWIFKDSGTLIYGTLGFYLPFSNSAHFGEDFSGNNNDFTDSGLATNDQVLDTPTMNHAVLNGIHHLSTATLTNGNLECSGAENEYGTLALTSGMWSWKITVNENGSFGIEATDGTEVVAADVSGESVEMLLDLNNGYLQKKVDGGSVEDIDLALDLTKEWYPHFKAACAVDFGQLGHTSTVAGYKTVSFYNLATPAIQDSTKGCVTDSDTGANIATTLAASRNGWGAYIDIYKNLSNIESWDVIFSDDSANSLHFDANDAKGAKQSLAAGDTYVGVSLRVGTSYGIFTAEVSHTSGVATDTAHSLGTAQVGIVKLTDIAGSWYLVHPDLTASRNLVIDTNAAEAATVYAEIDNTNITIASGAPTGTYRVIAIKEIAGYSKIGVWTGNGNANGPYHSSGRIAAGIYKNKDDADSWIFLNDERLGYNVDNNDLNLDTDAVEGIADYIDIVSQGVKVRSTNAEVNTNTEEYITIEWFSQPNKYSNAR